MATPSAARSCLRHTTRSCQSTTTLAALGPRFSPPRGLSAVAVQQASPFSSTAASLKQHKNRDRNPHRGRSVMRRTGPRQKLSVPANDLPRPVPREELPPVETEPDHGLWDFFYSQDKPINTPIEDAQHGRGWTVNELRRKSWDDLHKLWWVCVKERNRIATATREREQNQYGYGGNEASARDNEVKKTMRSIKWALTTRFYQWEDAVKLARNDAEVDLSGKGPAYTPKEYLEDGEAAKGGKQQTSLEAPESLATQAAPQHT